MIMIVPSARPRGALEMWFAPLAPVNADAVGLVPILLPIVAVRHGVGHVGLVMGAFSLGAIAAPVVGSLADRYRAHRSLATACAALCAVSLGRGRPRRPVRVRRQGAPGPGPPHSDQTSTTGIMTSRSPQHSSRMSVVRMLPLRVDRGPSGRQNENRRLARRVSRYGMRR